jgi:hypothetical protein
MILKKWAMVFQHRDIPQNILCLKKWMTHHHPIIEVTDDKITHTASIN